MSHNWLSRSSFYLYQFLELQQRQNQSSMPWEDESIFLLKSNQLDCFISFMFLKRMLCFPVFLLLVSFTLAICWPIVLIKHWPLLIDGCNSGKVVFTCKTPQIKSNPGDVITRWNVTPYSIHEVSLHYIDRFGKCWRNMGCICALLKLSAILEK